jgi:hypothetical protein
MRKTQLYIYTEATKEEFADLALELTLNHSMKG